RRHTRLLSEAHGNHPLLHSFPTRRSSDLSRPAGSTMWGAVIVMLRSRVLRKVHSKDHAVTAPRLRRRVRQPRYTTIGDSTPHTRSEEHTSELQSRENLVCRLLLEKKKEKN